MIKGDVNPASKVQVRKKQTERGGGGKKTSPDNQLSVSPRVKCEHSRSGSGGNVLSNNNHNNSIITVIAIKHDYDNSPIMEQSLLSDSEKPSQ